MSSFLSNIINRHTQPVETVKPRTKGIFDSHWHSTTFPTESFENNIQKEVSHPNTVVPNDSDSFTAYKNKLQQSGDLPFSSSKKISNVSPLKLSESNAHHGPGKFSVKARKSDKLQKIAAEISKNPLLLNQEADYPTSKLDPVKLNGNQGTKQTGIKNQFPNRQDPKKLQQLSFLVNQLSFMDGDAQKIRPSLDKQTKNIHSPGEADARVKKSSFGTPTIPTIKIHIGRIEIKAINPSPKRTGTPEKTDKPGNSLEQFLKKRETKI